MSDKKEKPVFSTELSPEARRLRFQNKICRRCNSDDLRKTEVALKEPLTQQKAIAYSETKIVCRACQYCWTVPNFEV